MEELLEKLKQLNYEERLKLLEDDDFRNKIFLLDNKNNPEDFSKILELYNLEDIMKYYNSEMISKISKLYPYADYVYVFYMIRKDKKVFEQELVKNKELIKFILFKCREIYYELSFSYDTVISIIKFIEENNLDVSNSNINTIIFSSLNTEELQDRFLNENIKNLYKEKALLFFKSSVIEKYLKNNAVHFDNKTLYHLINYYLINLDSKLYETESFFNECILKNDIYQTRIILDSLSDKIDISYFNKLFNKYKNKILKEKRDYKIIIDTVIDNLFQDSTHNVFLNIVELVEYNNKISILSKDKLNFYKELLLIYHSDVDNILNFYNKYKDIYKLDDYYDDIRLLKNDSYNRIKNSCMTLNDLNKLKRNKDSERYNLDIYELNGEPFRMLISCRSRIPEGNNTSPRNCYTLIGNENMFVFNENLIIYGYLNYNINNIMHVYEADSYSLDTEINTTNYVNRIRTPEEILNANHKSEIQIKNNKIGEGIYERVLPSYIICFDKLNDRSIEAAKDLNIPIIIIDRTKYKKLEGNNNLTNYETEYTLTPGRESSIERKRFNRI